MAGQTINNQPPEPGGLTQPLVASETRLKDWLDLLEARLEQIAVAYNNASFNRYLGQPVADLNQYDAAIASLMSDPASQFTVRYWLAQAQDPTLRRRLELLRRAFLEAEVTRPPDISQLRNNINDRLLSFQPQLDGTLLTRSDITEILRDHPDRRYRQRVFEEAMRPLAEELEPQVRELMRLRNAQARRLGYNSYPDLHLDLIGFDRATLLALFDRLEALTAAPYRAFTGAARREYNLSQITAWDLFWLADRRAGLPDEFFQGTTSLTRAHALLSNLGLDPQSLPIQVFKRDIPFGGLCFQVRVPDDIRIVSSPKEGFLFFRTLVHEFGHGLHSAFIRQTTYLLKREWGPFNEGMAEVLAYFTHYDDWLAQNTGLDPAAIAVYKQHNTVRRIIRLRNMMAQARFEIEAYDNLNGDLNRLQAEQEARYLDLPLNLTPRWAAVSFPTTHPVYRQNYILADLIAAQTHAELNRRFGSFFRLPAPDRAGLFNFIRQHYFTPGALIEWRDKIKNATGQPLGVDAFITELGL